MTATAEHCYLVGEGTAWAAFVPVIGGYIKTHWCVLVTVCPDCGARPGTPCTNQKKRAQNAITHHTRRALAQRVKSEPKVRAQLLRAMPAVAFAIDALDATFAEEENRPAVKAVPVVRGRRQPR